MKYLRYWTVWASTVLQDQRAGHGEEEVGEEHLIQMGRYTFKISRSTNLVHSAEKSYKNFLILARYSVTPIHGCVKLVADEEILTIIFY